MFADHVIVPAEVHDNLSTEKCCDETDKFVHCVEDDISSPPSKNGLKQ